MRLIAERIEFFLDGVDAPLEGTASLEDFIRETVPEALCASDNFGPKLLGEAPRTRGDFAAQLLREALRAGGNLRAKLLPHPANLLEHLIEAGVQLLVHGLDS